MPTNADSGAPAPRPLPAHPNLEYERKRAKALLTELRRDDPEAKLTDAQFAIAREYGFLSWPRMVEYLEGLEREQRAMPAPRIVRHSLESYEREAQSIIASQMDAAAGIGLRLATYLPRFFGRSPDEAAAAAITLDEARQLVAREARAPSWAALVARVSGPHDPEGSPWERFEAPGFRAQSAVRRSDLATLSGLVERHPEVLQPQDQGDQTYPLLAAALQMEWETKTPEATAIVDWLVSLGCDRREAASRLLLGHSGPSGGIWIAAAARNRRQPTDKLRTNHNEAEAIAAGTTYVRFLLGRGADPEWVPPSGIPIIEYAILKYWNGAAVDEIAQRVTPRRALWIDAGLGHTDEIPRYFGRDGSLTPDARRNRPDFAGMLFPFVLAAPGAGDSHSVYEAAFVALINQRFDVLDVLRERGFDLDARPLGWTLLHWATANGLPSAVEYLIARGSRRDLQEPVNRDTAVEIAQRRLDQESAEARPAKEWRRIHWLLGGKEGEGAYARPREAAAPVDASQASLTDMISRARGGAARRGRDRVELDDLLAAALTGPLASGLLGVLSIANTDMAVLKASLATALEACNGPGADEPPLSEEAKAVFKAAVERAQQRRRPTTVFELFAQLVTYPDGEPARLIVAAGGSLLALRDEVSQL